MNKPNVIIIYADDLGYGDLSCYGAEDISTPNLDNLLQNGIRFDSGYSPSAVCTPARYGLLTGAYPFRKSNARILPGNAGCIIDKDTYTLPKVFKSAGYNTAVVGKWHLGLGDGTSEIDWNTELNHTPNDTGFDYSFIFPATNDRVPCVYIKDRAVQNLDKSDPIEVFYGKECPFEDKIATYANSPDKLRMRSSHGHNNSIVNGVGRIGYMRGGEAATWRDEDLAECFLGEVKSFISKNSNDPFFMFYALHQPHVPRLPSERFAGLSELGPRGDVILELDWCVGEVVSHLEKEGLLDNTIIIFSSDNGPILNDGYCDNATQDIGMHRPAGPLRGSKYSKYEGGARVPFILSWHNNIKPKTTDEVVSQVDFMASFADMLGVDLPQDSAPDSRNLIDLLLGKADVGRDEVVFEGAQKGITLRQGKWAYIAPFTETAFHRSTRVEFGNSLDPQLFNLSYDLGQRENVSHAYPEIAQKMQARVEEILAGNKTTNR